jgi:CxxC motif-containing protein
MKLCKVCQTVYTPAQWDNLLLLEVRFADDDDGKVYRTESRNCPCGATLAIETVMAPRELARALAELEREKAHLIGAMKDQWVLWQRSVAQLRALTPVVTLEIP